MNSVTEKSFLIQWVATLPEDDPRYRQVARIVNGEASDIGTDEALLSLKEVAQALGYRDTTLLHKLGIQKAGHPVTPGGRLRYRLSEVRDYLESSECEEKRRQLQAKRKGAQR